MDGGDLLAAVDTTLGSVPAEDGKDAALRELARRYAGLIDGAADLAEDLANLPDPENGNDRQALEALRRRAGEVETARDLGPKLLSTLQALGVGVAPAAAAAPSKDAAPVLPPAVSALEAMRRRRLAT
jgi:hypothetical protein